MQSDPLLLLPVLIQVALTCVLYIVLGKAKSQAAELGQVDEARRSLHDDAWPDKVLQINNCIRNQFEIPVLFYVVVFILWGLNAGSIVVYLLAWGFALSRIVHAFIHTGTNYVPLRRRVFTLGTLLVLGLTVFAFTAVFTA